MFNNQIVLAFDNKEERFNIAQWDKKQIILVQDADSFFYTRP
jgi:hypothetical protein